MKSKFDFNDILIEPATVSKISSRSEVNPYINGRLPLITAPMDTVVDTNNIEIYDNLKINVCLPRGEYFVDNEVFLSYSLDDFIFLYEEKLLNNNGSYLIDIANGHMEKLITNVKLAKEKYPNIKLMVGNIANPETYVELSNAGADFIRCGIGNGNACSTTQHTGIGYPMASLIQECYDASCLLNNPAKIVADGGMKTYSDIIKALALGCFLPDAIVNTTNGKKRIKDVEIGEYVYTHMNRPRKVTNKFIYDNNKEIVEINGIPSTSNHHYYVVNKKYKEIVTDENVHQYAEWVAAEDLNNEYLLIDIS